MGNHYITVVCEHCGEQGQREWTGGGDPPRFCSTRCRKRGGAKRWRQQLQGRRRGRCRYPDKIYFWPNPAGIRLASRRAAMHEQFVYPCNCGRFHLSSMARAGVPAECTDGTLSLDQRADAWFKWLTPQAAELVALNHELERQESGRSTDHQRTP